MDLRSPRPGGRGGVLGEAGGDQIEPIWILGGEDDGNQLGIGGGSYGSEVPASWRKRWRAGGEVLHRRRERCHGVGGSRIEAPPLWSRDS